MRTLFGAAGRLTAIAIALGTTGPSLAQSTNNNYQNSSQFGMTLPQASLPSGQDEIRTSDGTSCRSSVGGNGAYFDMGVIGTPAGESIDATAAAYGRIVVPLGRQAKRLDCTTLYMLEIERLKIELQTAKMGIGSKAPSQEADLDADWANEGWGDKRTEKPNMLEAEESEKKAVQKTAAKKKKKIAKPAEESAEQPDAGNEDGWVEPVNADPEVVTGSNTAPMPVVQVVHDSLYGEETPVSLYD